MTDNNTIPEWQNYARMTANSLHVNIYYYQPYYGRLHETREYGGGVLRINLIEQNIFKLIWAKCVLFVVWPRKDYWGILHGPSVKNYSNLQTVWLGTPKRKRILKRYGENRNWHFQQLTKNLKSMQKISKQKLILDGEFGLLSSLAIALREVEDI